MDSVVGFGGQRRERESRSRLDGWHPGWTQAGWQDRDCRRDSIASESRLHRAVDSQRGVSGWQRRMGVHSARPWSSRQSDCRILQSVIEWIYHSVTSNYQEQGDDGFVWSRFASGLVATPADRTGACELEQGYD